MVARCKQKFLVKAGGQFLCHLKQAFGLGDSGYHTDFAEFKCREKSEQFDL